MPQNVDAFFEAALPFLSAFDGFIHERFSVRLEPEALVEKIVRDEMVTRGA